MRKPPKGTPPNVSDTSAPRAGFVTQQRRYELITPLFGGGVQAGVNDPVTIIRGASIRGQLRFWWRACRGGRYATLHDMKEAEDAIWGAAATKNKDSSGPSQVDIAVQILDEGKEDCPFVVIQGQNRPQVRSRRGSVVHPYAAFPLQPSDREVQQGGVGMPTKAVRVGVAFTLSISFPEQERDEVEAALWAWETFGGIGARTRRGFGALCCTHKDGQLVALPPGTSIETWLLEQWRKYVQPGQWNGDTAHIPHLPYLSNTIPLPPTIKMKRPPDEPLSIWNAMIENLKQFRQQRHPGSQPNRPGRSLWSEPDAIRRLTGQHLQAHAPATSTTDLFLRGGFGLPIIFQFKDRDKRNPGNSSRDPQTTTLQGKSHDRLSSRLIIRPLAYVIPEDGTTKKTARESVGLALVLEAPDMPPGGVVLKELHQPVDIHLDDTKHESMSQEQKEQLATLLGAQNDILLAFLNQL